jgi:hypothetical protein
MEKLKQVLAQDDTVLFVGSGISRWAGLPSWPGLIEELAEFIEESGFSAELVRAEAQRGDLLQAASYGFHTLTKPQMGDFVRKACRYGIAKPHEIHHKLVSLGPRCYMTTNYDNLIEESLRRWQPDRFFRPPVTNRHLTEIADIVHARATDFIFKPHGDAGDSESIILTREQYRQFLPGGEKHAALESVKMLMVSRPVVYLGFGLRDPDFIYIRDLLSNTYKGGTRDHYAIIADVLEAEVDWWRSNYGIHIVGYTTTELADKSRDHSALLRLLDDLHPVAATASLRPVAAGSHPTLSETVLAMARHAARLARAPRSDPEFPIRVYAEASLRPNKGRYREPDEFDHSLVEPFLDEGPSRTILVGLPGAGKTYSMQRAAARLAEKLHQACLSEDFDVKKLVVPLLADFKLYRGDLYDLIDRTVPSGLSLQNLAQNFRVRIFLDSFNEMPREYWEKGSYEADFAKFFADYSGASIVVGSRTTDGLAKVGFPAYRLDRMDADFVASELARRRIEVGGRFRREILELLQKPFFFQLVASQTVQLPREAHPRSFYETFFSQLNASFKEQFGQPFNLEDALSAAAYEAINRGEEAQPLAVLLEALREHLERAGLGKIQAIEVANWLVSKSVVIPYRGARVAFFHQSATEYLAARELARRYRQTPQILKEKLTLLRWDQALLLTLSLLSPSEGADFLQAVVEADFALALNAAKYLEFGRDEVVTKLLSEIPGRLPHDDPMENGIAYALGFGLAVSEVHEPQLRTLMELGDMIGGEAVTRLVELKGASVKGELLKSLVKSRDDYNYCVNGIARALKHFAVPDDLRNILTLADSLKDEVTPDSDEDSAIGFIAGAADFLSALDVHIVRSAFLPADNSEELSEVRARILCHYLQGKHSTAALELAGELLLRGADEAATAICFISGFGEPDDRLAWTGFTAEHFDRLVLMLDAKDDENWGLRALKCICQARPDMAQIAMTRAAGASGILKAVLLYCALRDPDPVFEALAEVTKMDVGKLRKQPSRLLDEVELNWAGHESLFIQLLRLRDAKLARALLEGQFLENCTLGELDIGPIYWWLEWLEAEERKESGYWFVDRLTSLFGRVLNSEARHAFVAEFNARGSRFRKLLADYVLPRFPELTTDAFGEDAVSFLLADLNRPRGFANVVLGGLLGLTATEQFVTERLLPLVSGAKQPLKKNLQRVLREAGRRHGRRYVSS